MRIILGALFFTACYTSLHANKNPDLALECPNTNKKSCVSSSWTIDDLVNKKYDLESKKIEIAYKIDEENAKPNPNKKSIKDMESQLRSIESDLAAIEKAIQNLESTIQKQRNEKDSRESQQRMLAPTLQNERKSEALERARERARQQRENEKASLDNGGNVGLPNNF